MLLFYITITKNNLHVSVRTPQKKTFSYSLGNSYKQESMPVRLSLFFKKIFSFFDTSEKNMVFLKGSNFFRFFICKIFLENIKVIKFCHVVSRSFNGCRLKKIRRVLFVGVNG